MLMGIASQASFPESQMAQRSGLADEATADAVAGSARSKGSAGCNKRCKAACSDVLKAWLDLLP
jgi:hypothetical protein